MYKEKLRSREEICKEFEAGYKCVSNSQTAEPVGILDALVDYLAKNDIKGLEHYLLLPLKQQKYMDKESEPYLHHTAHFISGYDRAMIWEGYGDYMPSHYSRVPILWRDVLDGPDVYYCTVSPMDKHGYFSCGTSPDLSNVRRKAKKVLLEVNKTMPRAFGSFIHISEVTAFIENDEPITEVAAPPISDDEKKIGDLIAEQIPDGATIQLGIGGIPNAVAGGLMGKKDLGVHSEMFCDVMVPLTESGVITNERKNINRGKTVVTFSFGARSTYDFLDDNPGVEFLPVDYVNNPFVIAQNDNVMSINSCMEIDLFGQVCSESQGPMNFSGSGGQVDFIRGAAASKGGKSFMAFKSSAKKDTISKIKPVLTEGSVITTTRSDIDYVVTEQGIVKLMGLTASQRAKALISIAHPAFREELTKAAKDMHIIV
ncbi:MAG: 4-hydroxybutyrate--acetyl-CoA CoA transferase [Clostridiales Family XIII bacterium]|jgi:4-hydroxybutyrate CoA-transferase|nr:4-hydroxybutyrate--acetyl-CoA CoA transferase [Clostridiales Family XIII bacterium]